MKPLLAYLGFAAAGSVIGDLIGSTFAATHGHWETSAIEAWVSFGSLLLTIIFWASAEAIHKAETRP